MGSTHTHTHTHHTNKRNTGVLSDAFQIKTLGSVYFYFSVFKATFDIPLICLHSHVHPCLQWPCAILFVTLHVAVVVGESRVTRRVMIRGVCALQRYLDSCVHPDKDLELARILEGSHCLCCCLSPILNRFHLLRLEWEGVEQ